jgi:hypothetical protein
LSNLENEPLGDESESISNAVTEVYQSKSGSKWILGIVAAVAIGGLVLGLASCTAEDSSESSGASKTSATATSPPATPTKTPIIWPSSLEEITGVSSEELDLSEACVDVDENFIGLSALASPETKAQELKGVDGAHEAADFVADNAWVSVAAETQSGLLLESIADEQLESFLIATGSPDWAKMSSDRQNQVLFGILSKELEGLILSNCGLVEDFGIARFVASLAQGVLLKASAVPWYPAGFNAYPGDLTVAYRWADRGCSYSSGSCWTMDLITKAGADYVYVEISIEDSSGSYVDYSNDTARNLRAGQIAKLEFVSFNSGARTGRISEITVQ